MKITSQQRNTILAALRHYQTPDNRPNPSGGNNTADWIPDWNDELNAIATNEGTEEALTNQEIDALCEAINTDGEESLEATDKPLTLPEAIGLFPALRGLEAEQPYQLLQRATLRGSGATNAAFFIGALTTDDSLAFRFCLARSKWDSAQRAAAAEVFRRWMGNSEF